MTQETLSENKLQHTALQAQALCNNFQLPCK